MRILLSNDDGYLSPGIAILAQTLSEFGTVTVVAPERDRSGASNSLTLDRPLSVRRAANGFLYVNGTPTDCVHIAVTGFLDHVPDLVVSGVNLGANMGDDTIYSGTVAAATEGFLLGIPSIAISLAGKDGTHFASAARVAGDLVERCRRSLPDKPVLLNVNVPNIAFDQLLGTQVTRLGKRHKAEAVIKSTTPRGETVYWIGAAGAAADAGSGTDFHAVAGNCVSVTPLQIDLTHNNQIAKIVEEAIASRAYEDTALPIGFEQTISQPYVVARMIAALRVGDKLGRVLEVGTGCGYQAAVLAAIAREVYSMERIAALLEKARVNLRPLRLANLRLTYGDGAKGLPEAAPFDAIILAAATPDIPRALLDQLAPGGRLVAPVGSDEQELVLVENRREGFVQTRLDAVRFVPLRGGKQ